MNSLRVSDIKFSLPVSMWAQGWFIPHGGFKASLVRTVNCALHWTQGTVRVRCGRECKRVPLSRKDHIACRLGLNVKSAICESD